MCPRSGRGHRNDDVVIPTFNRIRNKDLVGILAGQNGKIERDTDLLLQTIDQQVLIEGSITLSADDYFKTASRAIDTVLNVFSLIINYAADNHAKLN